MSDSLKKVLISLVLGLVMVIAAMFMMDVFHAPTLRDTFRILSDCFFIPAALLLSFAGLTWAKNGGVWDGLGFTVKILIDRMKPSYERTTFAEYREQREEKNSSPAYSLIAGVVYLVPAIIFLALHNMAH